MLSRGAGAAGASFAAAHSACGRCCSSCCFKGPARHLDAQQSGVQLIQQCLLSRLHKKCRLEAAVPGLVRCAPLLASGRHAPFTRAAINSHWVLPRGPEQSGRYKASCHAAHKAAKAQMCQVWSVAVPALFWREYLVVLMQRGVFCSSSAYRQLSDPPPGTINFGA